MMTFNELKTDVYGIALQKFGQLTPEVKQRLDVELDAIEKYGKTELIVVLWGLFKHFEGNHKGNVRGQRIDQLPGAVLIIGQHVVGIV